MAVRAGTACSRFGFAAASTTSSAPTAHARGSARRRPPVHGGVSGGAAATASACRRRRRDGKAAVARSSRRLMKLLLLDADSGGVVFLSSSTGSSPLRSSARCRGTGGEALPWRRTRGTSAASSGLAASSSGLQDAAVGGFTLDGAAASSRPLLPPLLYLSHSPRHLSVSLLLFLSRAAAQKGTSRGGSGREVDCGYGIDAEGCGAVGFYSPEARVPGRAPAG
ncbi:unnamed protein product [Urochloa humidicola]